MVCCSLLWSYLFIYLLWTTASDDDDDDDEGGDFSEASDFARKKIVADKGKLTKPTEVTTNNLPLFWKCNIITYKDNNSLY